MVSGHLPPCSAGSKVSPVPLRSGSWGRFSGVISSKWWISGMEILWLPYHRGPKAQTREIELDAPGWAVIGYSRAQALQDRAVLPVTFGALDGEARWRAEEGVEVGPHGSP